MTTTATSDRNRMIDLLKGLCILFVIITHGQILTAERKMLLFPFWIDMAVPLFMIISGYVYSASYERSQLRTLGDAYSLRQLTRRVARYAVPFLMAFALEYAVALIYARVTGNTFEWLSHPVRTLLTGGALGAGSYYTPLMMQLIFVFPLIYFLIKRTNTQGLLICGALNLAYEVLQSSFGVPVEVYRLLLFRYLLLIAFGAYLYQNREKKLSPAWGWPCLLFGAAYIVANQYFGIWFSFFPHWQGTCLPAALFCIPVAAKLLRAKGHCAPLEWIGKASYHVYLSQMVFYIFGAGVLYSFVPNRALALVVSVVISLGAGMAFYYVERPIGRLVGRLLATWTEKYDAAATRAHLDASMLREERTGK
ncbi:MAG: acyltransferase [Clostridia bacterium]|nr:acyltransferase [Clostridia bacterium]